VRVEDSALERPEYEWSQFLHVTRQEHEVDVSRNQNGSNRRVQRGRVLVRFRRYMNGPNTGLASPAQGARVAIVAHDNRDAPLNAAIGTGIQQGLKRRSLMRGENSNVHESAVVDAIVSAIRPAPSLPLSWPRHTLDHRDVEPLLRWFRPPESGALALGRRLT
jgi:hypothetical protein